MADKVNEKELEDIKKLPPKERLKRLQELEANRKRQEEEAKKIIEQSLKEIKLDAMLEEIDVPKQKGVDINKLFEKVPTLEEEAAAAKPKRTEEGGADYGQKIKQLLPQNTVQEIQQWYKSDDIPPTREEFLEVYEKARAAYDVAKQSMEQRPVGEQYKTASEELVDSAVQSMRLMRSIGYKKHFFGPGGE